jgi:uncharacterized protein CbrC (UPF0167 family)
MTFKYFENPDAFTELNEKQTICNVCQIENYCFDAELFFGEDKLNSVCPECLGNGELMNRDIYTCGGDIEELKRQLSEINSELSESEIDKLAEIKTNELEKTTPYLVTWQEWNWPCIEGDYCKFIGFGSREFYERLAVETTDEILFKNSFYRDQKDESDVDYLWKEVLPEKEIKDFKSSNEYATLFYIFRSLNSDKIITMWDCS